MDEITKLKDMMKKDTLTAGEKEKISVPMAMPVMSSNKAKPHLSCIQRQLLPSEAHNDLSVWFLGLWHAKNYMERWGNRLWEDNIFF